jgi:RNA polymerase sigma-70 factor (ECF subfamily)
MSSGIGLILHPVTAWQPPEDPTLDSNRLPAESALATEVVTRAIAGDESARRELFEVHVDRVFGLAYRMIGDATTAEDITQEIFARAFDRLHQYRGDAPFGAWLHRVAVSTILNALRKNKAIRTREASLEEARYAAAPSVQLEPDLRDRVRAALRALPAALRVVVIMFDVEGYSHDEIAESLGITAGASRVRLSRARDTLRVSLAIDAEEWSS